MADLVAKCIARIIIFQMKFNTLELNKPQNHRTECTYWKLVQYSQKERIVC